MNESVLPSLGPADARLWELPTKAMFPLLQLATSSGRELDATLADLVDSGDRQVGVDLIASALMALEEQTYGALCPGLFSFGDGPLPFDLIEVRVQNVFRKMGITSWPHLVALRPIDLWTQPNFGATSLGHVMTFVVEQSIDAFISYAQAATAAAAALVSDDDGPVDEAATEAHSPGADITIGRAFPYTAESRIVAELSRLGVEPSDKLSIIVSHRRRADIEQILASPLVNSEEAPTFGSACPGLVLLGDEPLPMSTFGTRATNVFRSIDLTTWGQLCDFRPRSLLAITNFGFTSLEIVSRAAVSASLDALSSSGPDGSERLAELSRLFLTLARWAMTERDTECVSDVIAMHPDLAPVPDRVQADCDKLLALPLAALTNRRDVSAVLRQLLDTLEERDAYILRARVWVTARRHAKTLEELGEELGVTRERVRQCEQRGLADLREILREPASTALLDRAFEISHRLGTLVPVDSAQLAATLQWAARDIDPDLEDVAQALTLWLAGPYTERDGWLIAGEGPDPRGADLRSLADNAGFLSDTTATGFFDELAVRQAFRAPWMDHIGAFHRLDGGWWDASGSIVDAALRFLALRGVPMTVEEILDGTGRHDASVRSVRQRLFEHPAVARVTKTEVALVEWGLEEYTTVADEIVEELERCGGALPLDVLVERLVDNFGVSPTSVRMYAARPMFTIDQQGVVRVRPDDEPYEVRDDLVRVAGCYELSPTTAAWRVRIDRDILRGSGRHIPEQLAGWLRLRPGANITLSNPTYPLPVAWRPWGQPDVGSLKAFAEATNVKLGDWLVLVFERRGSVEVRHVPDTVDEGGSLVALAQLIGIDGAEDSTRTELLQAIGQAVEVDVSDLDTLPFRIRGALELRRDQDVLPLAEKVLFG